MIAQIKIALIVFLCVDLIGLHSCQIAVLSGVGHIEGMIY